MLHFTNELGEAAIGGVGTMLNDLRRVSDPDVGFVLLGAGVRSTVPSDVVLADYYDIDVLQALTFETAVFHHYGLAYLADDSFLRGRRLVYVVHSVPTTEPWDLIEPYGGRDDIARAFERLCDAADRIVCVSEAERGKLLLLYPDLAPKTVTVRNGFSAYPDQPAIVRPERRVFGYLGRADYRKGLRELLREFAVIDGELRVACGAEDEPYHAQARADAERLGSRVQWHGRIVAEDKLSFLRSLDALVVPSRWEPFGYVALEALRAGIPPIVSRQGGLSEIVGPSYRYAFDPSRPGALAECMRLLKNDAEATVRAELEAAREEAKPLTAKRMAQAYRAICEREPAPTGAAGPVRRYAKAASENLLAPFDTASATPHPALPQLE
ncbi:glycosyltransferase family 4 protein [Paenibacillus sp. TRM 82003]|nr:glycosyltransferase family 4 protein [Paenibacillus sp. TRM 82003]